MFGENAVVGLVDLGDHVGHELADARDDRVEVELAGGVVVEQALAEDARALETWATSAAGPSSST
jgi:hypothetical protein